MSHRLDNYLRTYRRRAGLKQDDVALLLGRESGTQVSRYERRGRLPTLKTALAYGEIFQVPVQELFAGIAERLSVVIAKRACRLTTSLNNEKQALVSARDQEKKRRAREKLTRQIRMLDRKVVFLQTLNEVHQ